MKSKEVMISQLADYERNNELIEDIYRVMGDKADEMLYKIDDLYKQLNIDTATWGLDIWEKNIGIDNNKDLSYRERRGRIKTRLKGFGKLSIELLEDAIQDYHDNKVDVIFNGRVIISIPLEGYAYRYRPVIEKVITQLLPAHIAYYISVYMETEKTDIYIAASTLGGEELTVYPYAITNINLKGDIYVGIGHNISTEEIKVYPGGVI